MGWLFGLLFASAVFASTDKFSYPEQKLSAKGIERLDITGVRGVLKLTHRPGKSFRVRVSHSKRRSDDWHLSVERVGRTLRFEVFNVLYGNQWRARVKRDGWPEFDLSIEGPSVPAVVSWRDGRVLVSGWAKPLEGSVLKGSVRVRGGRDALALHTGRVDVDIEEHSGDVRVQGESGSLRVARMRGGLEASWLEGIVELDQVRGKVTLDSARTQVRGRRGQGEWALSVREGQVLLEHFLGRLKGEGEHAIWAVSAARDAVVEIVSGRGRVDTRWLSGGAKVFLTSEEGRIRAPAGLKILDRDGVRVARGQLGKNPRGQLFVRTDSGEISFK